MHKDKPRQNKKGKSFMKNKKKFKKPNSFVYAIYRLCSKVISRVKLNLKVTRNELKKKKGPFLLVANHESFIDFVSLGAYLPKLSFVVSRSFYNTLPIQKLMSSIGVIPKQQFQTTPKDLMRMKEVVKNNLPLAIYPAGLMTEQGVSTPIPESTGKFVKWMDQDVYVAKIRGTYLSKPKWSKTWRKGKSTLEVYKLIDKEDLKNLTSEQVYALVEKELGFNAYQDQEQNMIKFKNGDNVVGLDGILYKCPKCNKEFTIIAKDKNTLTCTNCGNSCVADKYGFLNKTKEDDIVFKHPSDWATKIENELVSEIASTENFELADDCQILLLNDKKRKYQLAGQGRVMLNKEWLMFDGEINGQKIKKQISSNQYPSLPFTPNSHFEIQDGEISYRIKLKNAVATTKWIWAIKCFYEMNKAKTEQAV